MTGYKAQQDKLGIFYASGQSVCFHKHSHVPLFWLSDLGPRTEYDHFKKVFLREGYLDIHMREFSLKKRKLHSLYTKLNGFGIVLPSDTCIWNKSDIVIWESLSYGLAFCMTLLPQSRHAWP